MGLVDVYYANGVDDLGTIIPISDIVNSQKYQLYSSLTFHLPFSTVNEVSWYSYVYLNVMHFLLDNIHVHLFSSFDLTDSLETAKSLRSKLKDKLDGEPVVLPVPENAPSDIPRILLNSKDAKYTCHISSVRLELSYSEPGLPKYQLDEFSNEYLSLVENTLDVVKSQWKSKISSLGITIELIALSEDPVTYLKEIYIKEGLLASPIQLGITYMDKLQWYDIEINRGYRLYAGEFSDESGSPHKLVTMYCDINTLSGDKKDYDKDILINIVKKAITYVSENIDVVFPQT